MGAKHALAAALRNHFVRATGLWYGETIKDAEKLKQLAGPVLLVDGSRDGRSAAEDSAAFSRAADTARVGAEVFIYPGASTPLRSHSSIKARPTIRSLPKQPGA